MSPRRQKPKGPPSINIRPIPETVKRAFDVARAQQGARTYLAYFQKVHALHEHVQAEARKTGAAGTFALAALKAAGLRLLGD
jgi:hypothetical protein